MTLLSEVRPSYRAMYEIAVQKGTITENFDHNSLPQSFRVRCTVPSDQQSTTCRDLKNMLSSKFEFSAGVALGHASLGHPVIIEGVPAE